MSEINLKIIQLLQLHKKFRPVTRKMLHPNPDNLYNTTTIHADCLLISKVASDAQTHKERQSIRLNSDAMRQIV